MKGKCARWIPRSRDKVLCIGERFLTALHAVQTTRVEFSLAMHNASIGRALQSTSRVWIGWEHSRGWKNHSLNGLLLLHARQSECDLAGFKTRKGHRPGDWPFSREQPCIIWTVPSVWVIWVEIKWRRCSGGWSVWFHRECYGILWIYPSMPLLTPPS